MQDINDKQISDYTVEEQLELAKACINNMLRNYLGNLGKHDIPLAAHRVLKVADLLGVYDGFLVGRADTLTVEWGIQRKGDMKLTLPNISNTPDNNTPGVRYGRVRKP